SSGQVFIKGKKGKAQDQIAVLLQENTIPSQLKVKELIAFFQDISDNGLSKVEIQALLQFKDDQYQQFA
ncbi:ABC transporter ATP-binding protein, partial [Streptococcus thermophilus]